MGFLHYNTAVEEQVGMVQEVKLQSQASTSGMNGIQVACCWCLAVLLVFANIGHIKVLRCSVRCT